MVKLDKDRREKAESIRIIRPAIAEGKGRPEKKHHFKYKNDYIKEMQMKEKKFDNKQHLNQEFKILNKMGFSQKVFENMPNSKLLSFDFKGILQVK